MTDIVFRYKPHLPPVLTSFSVSLPRGGYYCLVGPSGSGKSTVLAILMGFRRQSQGTITISGQFLTDRNGARLREQIAVVFQEVLILNGTIADNIRYGKLGANLEQCKEAARLAECDFIDTLENKYDTIVGDSAEVSLSGGQSQRICLARALVRDPRVLLLDEATSALDAETEASVVRTFERLAKRGMTIVSVTHRLATSINADTILVMQNGRLAEEGRYEELLDRPQGLFAKMVASQEKNAGKIHDDDDDDEEDEGRGSVE